MPSSPESGLTRLSRSTTSTSSAQRRDRCSFAPTLQQRRARTPQLSRTGSEQPPFASRPFASNAITSAARTRRPSWCDPAAPSRRREHGPGRLFRAAGVRDRTHVSATDPSAGSDPTGRMLPREPERPLRQLRTSPSAQSRASGGRRPHDYFCSPGRSQPAIALARGCRTIPNGCTKVTTAFWGDPTGARQAAEAELPKPK
jgi:hypothetical protein